MYDQVMKAFTALCLALLIAPAAHASRSGPGTRLVITNSYRNTAVVQVGNSGDRRGTYTVGAYTESGEEIDSTSVSLSPGRSRRIRFRNLPNTPVKLCSTVEVSPSLSLRSCALR